MTSSLETTDPSGPSRGAPTAFSVDVPGLLAALTEQFPDPLLCVRELVQNAADAGARQIDIEVSHDAARGLVRLCVRDDGRGMGAAEVEGYLTIGFSEKDPGRHRGRFGIGKLSPYALGFERMVVETSTGGEASRIVLAPDGSGIVETVSPGSRGTEVRVYKAASRLEAKQLSDRVFAIARSSCGSIRIPLTVNGARVNQAAGLPTRYVIRFEAEAGSGVLGLAAEPTRTLLGGGIVLETGAPILGPELSYVLDSPRLSPTLSRNAVRRDVAFEALLQAAQTASSRLVVAASRTLETRVRELRRSGAVVERALDSDDRAALEWLRAHLLDPEVEPVSEVKAAPVLETADGDLVSASVLAETLRQERRIPISRVPRTTDELAAYADRGVPVLLLYRDLEDFLERQRIETVEVDELDEGAEVAPSELDRGEAALVRRPLLPPLPARRARLVPALLLVAATIGVAVFALWVLAPSPVGSSGTALAPGAPALVPPTSPAPVLDGKATRLVLFGAGAVLILPLAALILWGRPARRRIGKAWLRDEAGMSLVRSEGLRRLRVATRVLLHPVDFAVARGWSLRSARPARGTASGGAVAGYRAFVPETPIRSGARLDLDRLDLGMVELVSRSGDPSDAKILIRRAGRVLLNRHHPTVRHLGVIAASDPTRARILLDALLATDGELARGCDPRRVEWDLVARAPRILGGARRR